MHSFSPYNTHEIALGLLRPHSQVLDVGCGPGTFAAMARTLGCEVVGLDVAENNIAAMAAAGFDAKLVDLEDPDQRLALQLACRARLLG